MPWSSGYYPSAMKHLPSFVRESGVRDGLVNVYAQGATAAIMIQENRDASVPTDVVHFLRKLVPPGAWLHDRQDNNGDAHIESRFTGHEPPLASHGFTSCA